MNNQIKKNKKHFYNLDALRFLAAFSVFIFHFVQELKSIFPELINSGIFKKVQMITSKGTLGVNFFFVLSGFLITYLIFEEQKLKNKFNLKNFLIRRFLRIWPLYFIIIIIGFYLFPLIFNDYSTVHSPLYYITFLANFDEINVGLYDSINFLTAPWSVAVEEQFYLFWGLFMFLLFKLRTKAFPIILIGLIIFSIGFSYLNINDPRVIYYHTFSVMSNILIGAGLAYFYFNKANFLIKIRTLNKISIILIYLLGGFIILFKNKIFIGQLIPFEHLIISLFFAFIIYDQIELKHSFYKIGKVKLFNYLGKISYGLYLYHLIVIFIMTKLFNNFVEISNLIVYTIIFFVISISLTILVSSISYRFIEKPFLKLKQIFY